MLMTFINSHFLEIILGLVSAGALTFCRYMYSQLKKYRELLDKEEDVELEKVIDSRLAPFKQEIDNLKKWIQKDEDKEKAHMNLIISSYRFRLLQLCKDAINQGFLTQYQYDQLTEFYKVYHGLGGNGQVKEYYEKAIELDIQAKKENREL